MRRQARRTYETTYTAARNYEMLLETYERAIRNNEARRAGLVVDRLNPAWRFESHTEQSYRVSTYRPKVAQRLASPENQDL